VKFQIIFPTMMWNIGFVEAFIFSTSKIHTYPVCKFCLQGLDPGVWPSNMRFSRSCVFMWPSHKHKVYRGSRYSMFQKVLKFIHFTSRSPEFLVTILFIETVCPPPSPTPSRVGARSGVFAKDKVIMYWSWSHLQIRNTVFMSAWNIQPLLHIFLAL
jgi:hypothetical protein